MKAGAMNDSRVANSVAGSLVNELRALGNVYHQQSDYIRAEQHYRLALSVYETSFPDQHEDAFLSLLGLVAVLERQNKLEEARQWEQSIPVLNARRRAI